MESASMSVEPDQALYQVLLGGATSILTLLGGVMLTRQDGRLKKMDAALSDLAKHVDECDTRIAERARADDQVIWNEMRSEQASAREFRERMLGSMVTKNDLNRAVDSLVDRVREATQKTH
jgi:hypothetical protein